MHFINTVSPIMPVDKYLELKRKERNPIKPYSYFLDRNYRITVEPNTTIELEVDEMGMSRVLSKRLSKPRKLQNDLEEYDKQMAAKFKQKFGM